MRGMLFLNILTFIVLCTSCSPRRPLERPVKAVEFKKHPRKSQQASSSEEAAEVYVKPQRYDKGLIILDAGHGGDDFGTHSLGKPQFHEKHFNLATTKLVQNLLMQSGYRVVMTRMDDTFIALDKRASFANEKNPRIFVSIHYNSAPAKEADGIEVYYFDHEENKVRTAKSKMLAQAILAKAVKNTGAKSRGVKHGNYAVLRETKMPAALIEGGFMTNAEEMEKIKDSAYTKKLALGIAQGIIEYLHKDNILADQ